MSTLTVSNVSDGTLSIPTTYVTNGSAKAWGNLNGIGTIALRDSFNVSSVTDNGTGNYTKTLINAMASANYSAFQNIANTTNDNGFANIVPSAGSYLIFITTYLGTANDAALVLTGAHGDLA